MLVENVNLKNNLLDSIKLGVGFNTFTGETRGMPFVFENEPKPIGIEEGQNVIWEIAFIENTEQLFEKLGLNTAVAYKGLFYRGSTKAEWASETSINSKSVYMLVKVSVKNSVQTLPKLLLTENAKNCNDPKKFYQKYGDAFIESIVSGGEFFALYTFKTKTLSEKSELSATIKASCRCFSAAIDFSKAIQNVKSTVNMSIKAWKNGGRGILPTLTPQSIINYGLEFPELVDAAVGSPVLYSYELKDYNVVDKFNIKSEPFLEHSRVKEDYLQIAECQIQSDAGEKYCEGLYPDIEKRYAKISDELKDAAEAIVDDPTILPKCKLQRIKEELNEINYLLDPTWYEGPYGINYLSHEVQFNDASMRGIMRTQLRRLKFRAGAVIDALGEITYEMNDGIEIKTDKHGGPGGGPLTLELGADEYICKIMIAVGHTDFGTHIGRIEITTNKNRLFGAGSGGYNPEIHFVEAPEGYEIFAFCGHNTDMLDALGVAIRQRRAERK